MSRRPVRTCLLAVACLAVASAAAIHAAEVTPTPAPAAPTSTEAPRTIDLATALRLATAGNFEILQARARLREAEARVNAADGGLLPNVLVGAGYQRSTGATNDAFGNFRDAEVNLANATGTLRLSLNLGESIYRDLAARRALDAQHDHHDAAHQRVLTLVAVRYIDLVTAIAAQRVQEQVLKDAQALVALAETRDANGLGSVLDSERARAQAAASEQRLIALQADRQRRAKELAVELRLDPALDLMPMDEALTAAALIDVAKPMAFWLEHVQRHSPVAAAATLDVAASQQEARAVRWSAWGPELAVSAYGAGVGNAIGELDDRHRTGWSASVGWTLSLGAAGRIDAADARSEQATLALERLRLTQRAAVAAAYDDVLSSRRLLEPARREQQAAEHAYALAHTRFVGGVLGESELLIVQQAVEQARLRWLMGVAHHNQAQVRLLAEAGAITIEALTKAPETVKPAPTSEEKAP